jgi:allantoin racemase
MHWLVLNPNTSSTMTEAVVEQLSRYAPAGTAVQGLTALAGCTVIDSSETFDIGAQTALAMVTDVPADTDAVLLACFGDPGLDALRSACVIPVLGLANAALQHADAAGEAFAIVTAGANWVSLLRERSASFGTSRWLVDVYALDGNGADLRRDPAAFRAQVHALSVQAGARTLILGGAAFAGLEFAVDARLSLMDVVQVAAEAMRCEALKKR